MSVSNLKKNGSHITKEEKVNGMAEIDLLYYGIIMVKK